MISPFWLRSTLLACGVLASVSAVRGPGRVGLADLADYPAPATSEARSHPASPVTGLPLQNFVAQGQPANFPRGIDVASRLPPARDPGPSRPPGLRIVFPSQTQAPVLDEHIVGILSANIYRGNIHQISANVLNDQAVRERLVSFSEALFRYPDLQFRRHYARHIDSALQAKTYMYMYRPISSDSFATLFPQATYDKSRVLPIVAYRTRAPQQDFLSYGRVEIAGVALVVDRALSTLRGYSVIPQAPLRDIIAELANRPAI